MIDKTHIEKFIKQLQENGYTNNFYAPGVENKDLATTLDTYLGNRLKNGGQLGMAFPFWMSMMIQGDLTSRVRADCLIKVNYNELSGLQVDRVKIAWWNRQKNTLLGAVERQVNAMDKLPDIRQIVRYAQTLKKSLKRTHPRL